MQVIRLSESVINQIAAGEVVERPASVIKELIENAVDAGASRVDVVTAAGGKNLIKVSDDGGGMSQEDLTLAVERHCTSKLSDDLLDIKTLGFRGEALPSIGSVSRLSITTRRVDEPHAWQIKVTGGKIEGPSPAALSKGTVVEVSDLFYSTPARLKFLKTDRAETNAITEIFKRMALAFPAIRFSIHGSDRSQLEYAPAGRLERINQVLGKSFGENALEIDASRENVRLSGFASLPTYNRGNALHQFFFVNGRPVKDKALLGAVRGAYSDFLAHSRHGVLALFVDIDPHFVDVNVHPAKTDVRFRDPGLVRGLIVGSLKQAFAQAGHLASSEGTDGIMKAFKPGEFAQSGSSSYQGAGNTNFDWRQSAYRPEPAPNGFQEAQSEFSHESTSFSAPSGSMTDVDEVQIAAEENHPLGAARAQLHKNYIVSQTENGLIIVDQHAAHERIVYEALKVGMEGGIPSQLLLIPEVVELPEEDVNRLVQHAEALEKLGLAIEQFGPGAIAVRETPAMLGEVDAGELIRNLADEIAEWGSSDGLKDRLEYVAATMACHGSVRSGRLLKGDEMNALLRQMEVTPNAGQCNHGRPTYIELSLKDIERLFGR
ncbi:MAG: DNA mismatch repair endonuclease MutL [Rhizobiaceae bacterium]|nr:DNA mismatch repair endonuclease MutL [Rhizobiaceae bacterium]